MQGITLDHITHEVHEIPKARNHPFNATYEAAVEEYASKGLQITTPNGFSSLLQDANAVDNYKGTMFGDIANEDARAALETIFDNDRRVLDGAPNGMITNEDGSVSNVSLFSYLNGPVIRAIWARCIVPAVMKVVALKQTKYTLTYDIPYAVIDGVKKELPYDLVDSADPLIGLKKLVPKYGSNPAIQEDEDGTYTFSDSAIAITGNIIAESLNVYGENARTIVSEFDGRHVDANITLTNIKYNGANNKNSTSKTAADVSTYTAAVTPTDKGGAAGEILFVVDIPDAYKCVEIPAAAGGGSPTYKWVPDEDASLIVIMDLSTGRFKATRASESIVSFEFDAYLSSEDNRTPIQVKTRQYSDSVTIGTGQHIMVDTPVELIQDYAPSHQGADYAVTMTDIISEFYAGNMNVEMLQFYRKSLARPSSSQYISRAILRGLNIGDASFDIRIAHGENPSAYTDIQLKRCLSYYINEVRSMSRIEDGTWNIVGHLNNLMYVPDFKTEGFAASLNGDGDMNRTDVMGFKVGYTFGFTTNVINGVVKAISTPECTKDSGLVTFFTSTDERRPTYIFHPYSYTISRGYNNPHADALLPSLMVTKRHLFKEFVPSQIKLSLTNNDGSQFTAPKGIANAAA